MRRIAMVMALGLMTTPVPGSAQSIQGVWRLMEREVQGGPDAGVYEVQGGILVYGDSHFIWALDMSPDPRPVYESPNDSEVVESIQMYTSTAGTYELSGREIWYHRVVNLNPNGMLPENQPQVREVKRLSADRLETSGTNPDGVTTILRYQRVE